MPVSENHTPDFGRDFYLNELENRWSDVYLFLMSNAVPLMNVFKNDTVDWDIKSGQIFYHRDQSQNYYIPNPKVSEEYRKLGTAIFNIARKSGIFTNFAEWDDFDRSIIANLPDKSAFFASAPQSLLEIRKLAEKNRLPDGVPQSINIQIQNLLNFAKKFKMTEEEMVLQNCLAEIDENIFGVKDIYRIPRLKNLPNDFPVHKILMPGDISYTLLDADKYNGINKRLIVNRSDSSEIPEDKLIISMSAEYFAYGPDGNLDGNVALITNGASFALETLDRLTRAGVRLGFASDLRLDFTEEKFYWTMKMALENESVNTIALNVLTTLGSSLDIAKAIKRICDEYKDQREIKFVVKMEGRDQQVGMDLLESLRSRGMPVFFEKNNMSLDSYAREIRNLDGMPPDRLYEQRYGDLDEFAFAEFAEKQNKIRRENLVNRHPLSHQVEKTINFLSENGMLTPFHIFGSEYKKAEYGKRFRGKPVVVIFGSGRTTLIQAELSKKSGTETIIVHPDILQKKDRHRDDEDELWENIEKADIPCFKSILDLQTAINENYPDGKIDIIGVVYEQFKPFKHGESYVERVSYAIDQLYDLDPISILIPSEMIPSNQTRAILERIKTENKEKISNGKNTTLIIGPNSPGFTGFIQTEDEQLRAGQIPPNKVSPGKTAVYGVGGTSLFEALSSLKENNLGSSWAVSIGGDTVKGIASRDLVLAAENDINTNFSLVLGEPGGNSIDNLIQILKSGRVTKPVIALLNGYYLPDNCYLGHAGSVSNGQRDEWVRTMRDNLIEAGAFVVYSPEQAAQIIKFLETNPRFAQINKRDLLLRATIFLHQVAKSLIEQSIIYQSKKR